ncbi:phage head-tail joining protein [Azospirillum sp. B506]|uniref:phage head-tail joining protein n=1 Tax=Azospirillum sp. B506 TaxID=137721 RepID=UPI00034A6827|nr:gpW family head-tail joining protein [Azospirillum sp. B506]
MTDVTTLEAWLADARAAHHALRLGRQTVSVRFGDRVVDYAPANVAQLASYIASLERQIAAVRGRRGPTVSPYVGIVG